MRGPLWVMLTLVAILTATTALLTRQTAVRGRIERVSVHGPSLEGNLAGDSPDRSVSVYLPPGYAGNPARRYPVLYLLHGFADDDNHWFGRTEHFINVRAAMDAAFAAGETRELIVVMPDAYTRFYGSMYSNSPTTGDWETFLAKDLVAFVDARYRTLPAASSRGVAGHSMGGYGALRLLLTHPDVFSVGYALSACCLTPPAAAELQDGAASAEAVRTFADLAKADFSTKLLLARAAAWSPDPGRPPLFLDQPTRDGAIQPAVTARWTDNSPLSMAAQYIDNLRRLRGIAFDAGDKDSAGLVGDLRTLDRTLTANAVPHTFEIYDGTHDSRIAERFQTIVLPFVSARLAF